MSSFLDIYLNPIQGTLIHSFLTPQDEQALDSTCKQIREFNREHVYPKYTTVDTANTTPSFLRKLTPYIKKLIVRDLNIPTSMPLLEDVTIVVPLIVDVTIRRICEDTHRMWQFASEFLQTLAITSNIVHTVRIVPGNLTLLRADMFTGNIIEIYTVQDSTEGSHLQLYRFFRFPPFITFRIPAVRAFKGMFKVTTLHYPSQLATRSAKNTLHNNISHYTTWDINTTGLASMFFDLYI